MLSDDAFIAYVQAQNGGSKCTLWRSVLSDPRVRVTGTVFRYRVLMRLMVLRAS